MVPKAYETARLTEKRNRGINIINNDERKAKPMNKSSTTIVCLTLLMVVLAVCNVLWGSLSIPVGDVWRIVCGGEAEGHPAWSVIVLQGRIPQMLTAMLTGASLGTCGLLLQTAFRNPLAGPSILGIDSGANLGVAIVLLLLGGMASILSLYKFKDVLISNLKFGITFSETSIISF